MIQTREDFDIRISKAIDALVYHYKLHLYNSFKVFFVLMKTMFIE